MTDARIRSIRASASGCGSVTRPIVRERCVAAAQARERLFAAAVLSAPSRNSPYPVGMRIATWNVNSLKARTEAVEKWVERARPDVLLMQETKLADADAPEIPFRMLGYELVHHGEGRWNGSPSRAGSARRTSSRTSAMDRSSTARP